MNEKAYWIALFQAKGIGHAAFFALLKQYGTPRTVVENPSLIREAGLRASIVDELRNTDWGKIEQDLRWEEKENQHIVLFTDERYPPLLKEIPDPPPILYGIGDMELLRSVQIAIVGSRHPTASGEQIAFDFAHDIALAGVTVTSGLANGIDGASHRGALGAKGKTIAVMGTGADRVYPANHRKLAHEIVASNGLLLSALPLGTGAKKENFPQRNRLISGLSLGTLVVEAARQSGSLITAKLAADQGREVFAIPGSIHNPLARGCHDLIRQGAKLVETTQDIFDELPINVTVSDATNSKYISQQGSQTSLDRESLLVLDSLGFEPTAIDTVVERSRLTPESVSSILLVLELQGYIKLQAGGFYSRIK